MTLAIETFDLTKRFGALTAVDRLNLRVEKGTIHGFLGPNGAGKSTTIKILTGLLRPEYGKTKILGEDVTGDNPETRQKLGYMPELPKFPRYLTGHELLDVYGRMYGMKGQQLREKIPTLLDNVGLNGRGGTRIGEYSKGMQQRLGIAQALLNDPILVILDEPTIGLDPVGMVEVRDLIKSVVKKGTTVFLSSHLLYEVQQLCSHVTIINRGMSLASGTLEEISSEISQKTVLQLEVINLKDKLVKTITGIPFVTKVVRESKNLTIELNTAEDVRFQISKKIAEMGGVIVSMVQKGRGLEDVFLQLISESEARVNNNEIIG